MERCRGTIKHLGYTDVIVVDGRTTRSVLRGQSAAQRLDNDANRAEREEYWWSGDVSWTNPVSGSRVVVPERPRDPGLTFVVWGPDAEQTWQALQQTVGQQTQG